MKKIIILISLFFILTGCTMNYSVSFNSNGFVYDNLYFEELVEKFTENETDDWNKLLSSRVHTVNIKDEFFEEIAKYQITLKGTYNSYEKYINDEYIKKYVGDMGIDENDDECTLSLNFNEGFKYNIYGSDSIPPHVENLKINVSFPYKIIDSNATSIEGDNLIWELSENSNLDKIYITYENPNKKEKSNGIAFNVLVVVIVVLAAVFIVLIATKNKKNNAL